MTVNDRETCSGLWIRLESVPKMFSREASDVCETRQREIFADCGKEIPAR